MKVVCDNCRAVYKIPDDKLVKPVNKATCRTCGHRMLIPRPRKDASPDERTLVTAVPPTPPPAPVRARVEDDSTLPGRASGPPPELDGVDDVPVGPGDAYATPAPGPQRAFDPGSIAPGEVDATPRPAPVRPTVPEPPRTQPPPQPAPPAPAALPPAAPRASRTPVPAPGYNPAGDMTLALLGAIGGITGSFVLALVPATIPGISWVALVAVALGVVLSMTGGFVTLLVILTGARGRRRASRFMSLLSGGVLSMLVAIIIAGILPFTLARLGGRGAPEADLGPAIPIPPAPVAVAPAPEPAPVAPIPPPAPAPEPVAAAPAPEPAPSPARVSSPPQPAPAPRTTPPARTSPPPSTTARATPPEPAPARVTPPPRVEPEDTELELPDDDFTLDTKPAPSRPAPAAADSVPMDVIDIMLRNNVDIKKCFYNHMKAAGSLPSQVKVRFTIEPTGTVSAAGVIDTALQGTELDRCLSRTIKGLSFPPTSGQATKVTYPFQL